MQIVFPPAMIAGNLVHPISSRRACNRIIPIVMAPQPCADRSRLLPFLGMAEVLALMDVQDQIKYSMHQTIVNDIAAMNLMSVHLIPLHSPSKNAFVYENEDAHGSLLQPVFDYVDLFLSLNFIRYPASVIL